jgi:hypothetical protein
MMNPEAKAEFDRIVELGPDQITEDEKDFIRARRSYLSEEQKHVFAEILEGSTDVPDADEGTQEGESAVEASEEATGDETSVEIPQKKSKK